MDRATQERLLNEGRLAQTQEKMKEMRLRLSYLRDALRQELDPFEPVENLKVEVIKLLASDLLTHHRDYMKLLELEKKLCKTLGKEEQA